MLNFEASRLLEFYTHRDPKIARVFSRILADIELGCVVEADAWEAIRYYDQPTHLTFEAPPVQIFQVGMSSAFMNKQEKQHAATLPEHKPAFAKSFRKMTLSPARFARTVTAGYAFTVGIYKGDHRAKSNFVSSQMLALDFDNAVSVDDLLQHEFVQRYGGLLYPSPSSIPSYPKSRVVFFLDAPVTDARLWERLQESLIIHFADMNADVKCKDCGRFYYGSNLDGWVLMENTLPIDAVFALPEWSELRRREDDAQRARESASKFTGTVTDKSISGYSNAVMRTVSLAGAGERNDQLFRGALSVYKKRKEENWNISEAVLEQDLIRAAIANGLSNDDGHHSVIATIESARRRV